VLDLFEEAGRVRSWFESPSDLSKLRGFKLVPTLSIHHPLMIAIQFLSTPDYDVAPLPLSEKGYVRKDSDIGPSNSRASVDAMQYILNQLEAMNIIDSGESKTRSSVGKGKLNRPSGKNDNFASKTMDKNSSKRKSEDIPTTSPLKERQPNLVGLNGKAKSIGPATAGKENRLSSADASDSKRKKKAKIKKDVNGSTIKATASKKVTAGGSPNYESPRKFKRSRNILTARLFAEYNRTIFGDRLPKDLQISWFGTFNSRPCSTNARSGVQDLQQLQGKLARR